MVAVIEHFGKHAFEHVIPIDEVVFESCESMQWHHHGQQDHRRDVHVHGPVEHAELPRA